MDKTLEKRLEEFFEKNNFLLKGIVFDNLVDFIREERFDAYEMSFDEGILSD